MATAYPEGTDTFTEPSLSESTTLSSAGDATRNHTQHHRDMGDAVEAIEVQAALKTHDHSGIDDRFHGSKLSQGNTHENADTDKSNSSMHHTLGTGPGQAAFGDHTHDYNGPTIFNKPYILCTSTTRPPAPHAGLVIYEEDTNRMRVWAAFGADQPITGLDTVDSFDYGGTLYTDAAGRPCLRPADWEQWYADDPAATDHGAMGVSVSGTLSWHDEGSDSNTCIARRTKAADKETQSDDQVITWKTGDTYIENTPLFTEGASNDKYFRMSADRSNYLRLQVGHDYIKLFYTTTGPSGEKALGSIEDVNTNLRQTEWMAQLIDRTLSLFRSGEPVGQIRDTKGSSSKGPQFRGWGTGMTAGDRALGQTTPADETEIRIRDQVTYVANHRWQILPVANIPIVRLRQAKKQKLYQYGSILEWNEEIEDTFGFFSPSNPTGIVVTEPGLYNIDAAIQWDADRVPDIAHVILCINGVETSVRTQQYIRGNTFIPAFSQTVHVGGELRFNTGDVLSVKVSFSTNTQWLDQIFTFFGENSKVKSRIDCVFMRV